jgi:diguanylate cyclase (GGDEF)-like protein
MLGTCLLHTFVINGERTEITNELEKSLEREKKQYFELLSTRILAYKDTLTGVKSKLAYAEFEAKKNSDIKNRRGLDFAVAVFDVNGLKQINDTYGHQRGDQFIIDACAAICTQFKRSPVFRIGGDEFVAILERDDFDKREELTESFNFTMEHPADPDFPVVVALGITDYEDGKDQSFHDVFERADKLMYERKRELKSKMNCCATA